MVRPDEISATGVLTCLNAGDRIRDVEEVQLLGPYGFRAVVLDSEGNRVALHTNSDA